MSKSKDSSFISFTLEVDDRTEEERAKAKQARKGRSKHKIPMDSNYLEDVVAAAPKVRFNYHFDRQIRQVKEEPAEQNSKKFTIEDLFEAASSGEISKLQGLQQYLQKRNKHLSDSLYMSNGKTALLKALLNLKNGENDTIEYLLDIAEKINDLQKFINAAYTDSYYKGQTALHVAIERRSAKFVEMLVKKGADVHTKACGTFFQPNKSMCFYFGELPLSLAACTNQPDIVDFLMDNPYQPVDLKEKDSHGNMVLHALVVVADNSSENTEFVIDMYDHILTKAAQLHPKLKLEENENNQGLTPIKLAAKTGKFELFRHIVQREFKECRHLSRKITEWVYGPVCSSLYDLSSLDTYEKNSVLEIVVYGSEIPNRLDMLNIEPLNKLLEEKWERFAQWIFFFNFIVYLVYLFIFTAVAYQHQSGEPPHSYWNQREDYLLLTGQIITAIGALYFFLKGLIDMVRKRPRFQALLTDGYTDELFFLQALLFMVCAVLYFLGKDEYLAFLVMCLALSWVNLLYFSRGSKYMGIYSVMIQKMILGEIWRFLVVYMVLLIGFSAAVVTLLEKPKGRNLINVLDGTNNCVKTSIQSVYFITLEMFKFTIGIGDLEFTDNYKYKEVFYVLLIVYIVLTYILLLNMLIALMNKRVEEMLNESTSIWKLQRAITTLNIEWILPRCLKKRLRSGLKKDLGRGHEPDQRWCFSVEESNWKQWNRNLGTVNEDPRKLCMRVPSPTELQKEPGWGGIVQAFSKWGTQRRTRRSNTQELSSS
ncbi:transient receptor potential cation channel subfamily V member 1 isoform X1 [Myxocyprinus asiaticus]|uniref:transient receptor potential cation channel subfamily V member 1 isoform X1 n=1 Tax=Myxocyprinus asiaticus TaxID=70543 RepID=UPI0022213C71|nr:transient receptor potential cation channel subfamily V member 1 isoform X1 [Myxocyprinus asiaticus]